MHDFEYCVWLTTDDQQCPWARFVDGFQPHITIRSHIATLQAAEKLRRRVSAYVSQAGPLPLVLVGETQSSSDPDVHSVYHRVRPAEGVNVRDLAWWWPADAHVSWMYRYEPIDQATVDAVADKVDVTGAAFDRVVVKKCTGQYSEW